MPKKQTPRKWKVNVIYHPFPDDFARDLAYKKWVKVCLDARTRRNKKTISG